MASPEPLHKVVSWRRALTPVFVYKRYPGAFWLVLDAICDIATFHPRATLGVEALARRAGVSASYTEKIRRRLTEDGVIQLVTQSTGGRFTEEERRGAPGKANEYEVGPAARDLPLKLKPHQGGWGSDRGDTPSRRMGFAVSIPHQTGWGSSAIEPHPPDPPTHALSADVRVFRHVSGEVGGDGGGRRTTTPITQASSACRFCNTLDGHQDWCSNPTKKDVN
jgi:hypothetical protein